MWWETKRNTEDNMEVMRRGQLKDTKKDKHGGRKEKNGGKAIGKKTNLKMRKRWKWSYQKKGKEFRKSERKQKQRHLGKKETEQM